MYAFLFMDNIIQCKQNFATQCKLDFYWKKHKSLKIRQLLHEVSKKCLEMTKDGARLQMNACNPENKYQQWQFKKYSPEKIQTQPRIIASSE